jgi:hypothetical protein
MRCLLLESGVGVFGVGPPGWVLPCTCGLLPVGSVQACRPAALLDPGCAEYELHYMLLYAHDARVNHHSVELPPHLFYQSYGGCWTAMFTAMVNNHVSDHVSDVFGCMHCVASCVSMSVERCADACMLMSWLGR